MTATRRDLVTGIVITVIGVVYFAATFSIRETADIVTPRTFPQIVGAGLIVLGLFLAGQSVWKARTGQDRPDPAPDPGGVVIDAPPEPAGRKVVVQFALFFAYLAIVIPVGFVLSTAAFLMAVTSLYAPQKWIRNLVFSVLFSVAVYVVFVFGLAVYLPVGILG